MSSGSEDCRVYSAIRSRELRAACFTMGSLSTSSSSNGYRHCRKIKSIGQKYYVFLKSLHHENYGTCLKCSWKVAPKLNATFARPSAAVAASSTYADHCGAAVTPLMVCDATEAALRSAR
jgi:hypothetical protein